MRPTDEQLLADVRRVHQEEGSCPCALYAMAGQYAAETVRLRFGTWNRALTLAGLPLSKIGRKRKQSTACGRRVALTN